LTGTADIESLLKPVQSAHHISVVDVSAQRTKLEIYGPKVKEILGHVWEQDLRDAKFPIDTCTQGLMAKSPVILWHCCENCYLILVRSSFATHLWDVLADSTVEYL
jgi:sarcosine oxidase subunit gamma